MSLPENIKEIKNQLIDLYLSVKVRKQEDIDNLTEDNVKTERKNLQNINFKDLINYIQNSIDVLVEIRANEKYEEKLEEDESKNRYVNSEDPKDANGLKLYEDMLIKAEGDLRAHIRVNNIYNMEFTFTYIYSTNKN